MLYKYQFFYLCIINDEIVFRSYQAKWNTFHKYQLFIINRYFKVINLNYDKIWQQNL